MFSTRLQTVRAYGEAEAVNEYITQRSHQRRIEVAHVAELQRREQQNRDFIEYSYMENQDNYGDSSNASHIAANEDIISYDRDYNESTPDTGTSRMSVFERAVYYAMYIMHFGIAEEEVSRMEELMTVIYGFRPPYERHVKGLNKSIIHDYDHQRYFFCSVCMELMSPTQYICTNRSCKIFGLPIKRAKRMERSEVHIVNILPQVTDILVDNFHEIIEMHRFLHERIDVPDRSDRRLFDGYYANIENASEFNRRHLKILLSLSIDGFVPRRISKKEVWPLYLRVEGLPPSKADQYFNSVIAGMMHTRLKPTQKMIEVLFSRLEAELRNLREIIYGESSWTVSIHLFRGIADMAAQQALFGTPRWNSEYGCSKCYIRGQLVDSHRVWIPITNADSRARTEGSYVVDAEASQYGLHTKSFLFNLLPPCHFLGDQLHICSEGITRNRLRDLFSTSSKFPELRISNEEVDRVKNSLLGMQSHTYTGSLILSLEDIPTCKGAELEELASVVFPLVTAVDIITSPLAAVSLIGYWLCLRLISKTKLLTTSIIEKAQIIASYTKKLWIILAPQTYTMKTHWFFDHAMEGELTQYGTLYQWSSSVFESHHRRLQLKTNQTTTNSASLLLERYLLGKKIRQMFNQKSDNVFYESLRKKVENKHNERFPTDIQINAECYIPKHSRIRIEELHESEKARIMHTHEIPYEMYRPYVLSTNGAPPRVYAKQRPALRQLACSQKNDERCLHDVSIDKGINREIPAEIEEEVPQGNVYERREFHFDTRSHNPETSPSPSPTSLYDCISNNVLYMDQAAKYILSKMIRQEFNEAAFHEFARSNVVLCAKTTYGNLNRLNDPDNHQLWNIANRLSAEIARAIATKTARCMENTERNAPNANVTVSLHNCAKLWKIRANPPFKQLNLMQLTKEWQGRKGNTYQQLSSLYRFVLQRITEPPQKIQEFAVRMSKNGGRNDDLLNLPDEIEEVLKDFGEDLIGLGHDELKPWIDVDLGNSKFYKNLGETEDERSKQLEELREQQKDWRPHLFKCLQMALRDVRSYSFKSGKWIPSDHQSKRATPDEYASEVARKK